ncbi:MAG: D-2-hydroxyacid dehydrogenase [Chloroflexi bacterium]|nr:D-2-hydroxyacid dehydrogenase [Chloroflexota bacterium]MCL5110269.1 D-2-hydroxyacid dehydrogenase [Chloroflexota bacterium]
MPEIHVLLSGNFTAQQVAAITAAHPSLVIHGGEGGIAFFPPEGLDQSEITFPRYYPDLDPRPVLDLVEVIVASRLPADIAARAPRLKWVQALGAGVDHLMPAEALRRTSFIVTNVKGVHAIPMAETVLSMLLNFVKDWPGLWENKRHHRWQRRIPGELYGKTLGLVGLGKIGREVARVGKSLGLLVIGVRRTGAGEPVANVDLVLPPGELLEMLARSDFVVCCLPNTPETYHLIGEPEFRAMRPTAYFVNVGRGQVVDEAALARALREGSIAGAGLDVFEEEPLPETSPPWGLENVLIMPHIGGDSGRFMERCAEIVRENLQRYATRQPLLNLVDVRRGY